MADFAPYQSSPPETERVRSPPLLRSSTVSPKLQQHRHQHQHQHRATLSHTIPSIANGNDPWAVARSQRDPPLARYADEEGGGRREGGGYQDLDDAAPHPYRDRYHDYSGNSALTGAGGTYQGSSLFKTSLGIPIQLEACLAYLLLPPAGGVVLLLFEHKSDYVRFHAWQSALLFSFLCLVHVIFVWSEFISYILLAGDLVTVAYLVVGAWNNAETLDRVEVPFFGRLASGFVDEE